MARDNKEAALLQGAVRAVARNGLENTTTRSIGAEAGIDDAYIYRFYHDKEDLLCRTFLTECEIFVDRILQSIDMLRKADIVDVLEDRCRFVIACAWNYLKDRPDISCFFVRYYHSAGFQNHASDQYRIYLSRIIDSISKTLDVQPNAPLVMAHLMESMFSFASKFADGLLPDNEDTVNSVFDQLYGIFRTAVGPERKNEEKEVQRNR